jgi:tRNA pseudouridine38-40 synthase
MITQSCFRLYLAYVGTDFSGFQEQNNARCVAQVLRCALEAIAQEKIMLKVAGRTDAGVHAKGQVVSFSSTSRLKSRQWILALASKLPKDLSVWRIDQMPLGFDAQKHSIGKQYVYRIYQGFVADPFLAKTALHIRNPLCLNAMIKAAHYFIGHHDFNAFRSSLCTAAHARRYLWHVGVNKDHQLIEIDIRGNAFCMNMVRIMAGTLIEVGREKRAPLSIIEALKKGDRNLSGVTAKPHGLSLETVYYPDNLAISGIPPDAMFPRYPITKDSWQFSSNEIVYG